MIEKKVVSHDEKRKSGPLDADELAKAHKLIDELGTQKERGFLIIAKRTATELSEDREQVEIDGMAKVSMVNKKFVLDIVLGALDMSKKDVLHYLMHSELEGSEVDPE